MAQTSKRTGDCKPIAVIRSYRPIRIERELLAQVFDLAERGQAAGDIRAQGQSFRGDPIDDHHDSSSSQRGSVSPCESQQLDELEAVA